MYSFSDSSPGYNPADYTNPVPVDDDLIAGIYRAIDAGTMRRFDPALIDEVIDEALEDGSVDYDAEHRHCSHYRQEQIDKYGDLPTAVAIDQALMDDEEDFEDPPPFYEYQDGDHNWNWT